MNESHTGKVFNRLTVLRAVRSTRRGIIYVTQCECGELRTVPAEYLKNGDVKECRACAKRKRSALKNRWGAYVFN